MKFPILAASAVLLLSAPVWAQKAEAEACKKDASGCDLNAAKSHDLIVVTATGAPSASANVGQAITVIDLAEIERRQPSTISDLIATTPGITISNTGPIGGFSAVRIRGAEGEQALALIDGVRLNDPSSPGGGFDFANLLVGNIDRVEILRGPNSVPWGSQAIGGVVNITTLRPSEDIKASARAEYGSNDRTNFVGNLSGATGPVGFSLGGGWFRDDGISAAASGTEADGYRQYAANGRIEAALGEAISIDLRGYYAGSRAELDGFPPPFYSLSDTAEYSMAQQLTGHAGINAQIGALRNRLAFTISDINRDQYANPTAATPAILARGRSERFEYRGDWQPDGALRAVFGAEHERSRFSDGFSPANTRYSGAYVQAIIAPFARLTLTAGARIDDHASYGSKATFSANAVWRPGDSTLLRVAYGEGFKTPTLYQLFSFYGDPTLQPEKARSYEIGFEQAVLDNRLRFGATAFRRRMHNMIDFDLFFFRYNNIVRSRANGVESFVELRPGDRFTLRANYSYVDSEKRENSAAAFTRHLRRPVHSLNISIDWNAWEKIRLGGDLRIASDSLDGFGGSLRMDGYALVALRAAVPVNNKLEFFGRIENATDQNYQTVANYNAYGRNAHIGLRAKF